MGHDTHRLAKGRKLVLGGVTIEFELGLVGHSDADVLMHAVTDALLGAAGLGDIGDWFPNTDPQWSDADSSIFVRKSVEAVRDHGWQVINLDCTISAQEPKLSPYKSQIRNRLAELLEVSIEAVNVKAKTGENVGPIGRMEAISADAIVLLESDA
jgi:2-C-methyl-D-erythritol 2,4-cyclodiphosphate synthase